MATYFTSDTHFGHANIIRYCKRPFSDVTDMDETMIRNWNAVVAADDLVYHLGDFCSFRDGRAEALFWRLNGRKVLIEGNHDVENDTVLNLPWELRCKYLEVTVDHTKLVLFHYPMQSWHHIGKNVLHLFGHMHGRLTGTKQSTDVGVDCFDFKPVNVSSIIRKMKKNPELPKLPPAIE